MTKLIYVDDDLPGITRKRSGKGWSYYDPKGNLIRDRDERERLNSIALPPAYIDAWFCPAPNGHILATGYDARGRKQYRYHPDFRAQREEEKFDDCVAFGKLLPLVRKRVAADLSQRGLTRERAIASIVRLLDLGALRIGNEAYTRRNKSFGATTLRAHHAKVTGHKLRLRYRGKGGAKREMVVSDRALATIVRRMQDLPGQRLFRYIDDEREYSAISSSDVNEYLAEAMGESFTAKNFRTWHGSVMAFELLIEARGDLTIKSLTESVATRLGNTPGITRKSYIHPAVFGAMETGWFERAEPLPRATKWLTRGERGFLSFLTDAPVSKELLAA